MRASIFGGLLATALMAVGCGAPMEQEEESHLSSQEAPIPDCSNSPDSLINFYSDPGYTNQVGARGCYCGSWVSWGYMSTYRQNVWEC
ncbi:hypothetical protein ACLESD_04900 [Pyxidicoccus sp. 3LFB2]